MSAKEFKNKRKTAFLVNLPTISLESGEIVERCKFNFSFFDCTQPHGQNFDDWSHNELVKLMDKLKNYSESSLENWRHKRVGGGGLKVFEIYGDFPKNSNFVHPKHVPHDVSWARFRLENLVRLVGFVVPKGFKCAENVNLSQPFDSNTFYVVFLDRDHKFYVTEEP
ncbi:hypothetical protein C2U55_10780 [Enterobacteriaceae bacterium ENNIH3]|nr:hypothetical protein C2U55_10780 [Enterobacteriaceae bacterium ENNIH3]AUV05134.1 hypothetical protein C2U52_01925 [Enterobacteriaceae bacterium ENNIH2]